ncbi:glycosyltransferase [Colwellia sp. TT2012]|uniref:glycosyltransferase n=1 Tax=Colwellia sp. TT2012 TaxID=1720342 RepID=UPI00071018A3|nr:glycosyltransferase [Colwellia sp. TT2012]
MEYSKRILIIASAGGHLTQAMCATSLCENISLVSNKKNISNDKIKKVYKIWDTQHNFLIHFFNIFYAVYVLLRERPSVVFSTGGPIVLPFALLCKFLPIKFVYLDTLSRVVELSNTGKLVKKYNLYNDFYCQWQKIAEKNQAKYIGKCFDILCENNYKVTSKKVDDCPMILVTVGTNQYDFARLFTLLAALPLYHDKRVKWVIQASHNKVTQLPANGEVVEMISRDEMESLVKQASLVISHCGIGSINLMLSYQKKVIFVPRVAKYNEFSDDHQLQIANEIGSELFTVTLPDTPMPEITFDELSAREILTQPVDITNYTMAKTLKNAFFS